ncbi:MAG: hypothetical protein RL367_2529 [Pseudomonadota bacterium]
MAGWFGFEGLIRGVAIRIAQLQDKGPTHLGGWLAPGKPPGGDPPLKRGLRMALNDYLQVAIDRTKISP